MEEQTGPARERNVFATTAVIANTFLEATITNYQGTNLSANTHNELTNERILVDRGVVVVGVDGCVVGEEVAAR